MLVFVVRSFLNFSGVKFLTPNLGTIKAINYTEYYNDIDIEYVLNTISDQSEKLILQNLITLKKTRTPGYR